MTTDIKDELKSLLPDRNLPISLNSNQGESEQNIEEQANKITRKKDDAEIRRLQKRAYDNLKHEGKLKTDGNQEYEIIETQELEHRRKPALGGELAHLNGTTPPQVARLLKSLNINLDIQLTKTDTKNLLATLLTCNEYQLKGLAANNKTPLAIKIVIKALQVAATTGDMSVVESLWNRIFGPTAFQIDLGQVQGQAGANGMLPQGPMSREAYVMIRETLIGIKEQ